MIIKRNMAVDSLTKVCEESLALIKQLTDADNETYGKGYEDGMAAQAKVQQTLKPWVSLTDEEILMLEETTTCTKDESWLRNLTQAIETKLKEKNNA